MQVAGLVAGAGLGLGLLLLAYGLVPRPRPLAEALAELGTSRSDDPSPVAPTDLRGRAAEALERFLGALGLSLDAVEADLKLLGRTPQQHLLEKLAAITAGFALPPVLAVILRLGGVTAPLSLVAVSAGCLATAGLVLPDIAVRSQAAERRRAFRFALSAYVDLVTVMLAAGTGVETALADAAKAGSGWSFEQLKAALGRTRLPGESPWTSFARLGRDLDLPELRELASSLDLAGTHGARVRASLEARAHALRARDLADMEASAEAATERMSVPSVVLVVGFIVFVGFPAAHTILGF